jgi:hypothetical protein
MEKAYTISKLNQIVSLIHSLPKSVQPFARSCVLDNGAKFLWTGEHKPGKWSRIKKPFIFYNEKGGSYMNQGLNKKIISKKKKAIRFFFWLVIFAFLGCIVPANSCAELEKLNKEEMRGVTGTGAVDFSIIGDTARIYFDVHVETYAEIDSLKLGYYQRDNLVTRKFLAPEDPMVKMSADEKSFELWPYMNGTGGQIPVYLYNIFTGKWVRSYYANAPADTGYSTPATQGEVSNLSDLDGAYFKHAPIDFTPGTPLRDPDTGQPFVSYVYWENEGTTSQIPHYIPYTDSANYQYKWNDTLGAYAEGPQGQNEAGFLGDLVGINWFSQHPSENQNHMDWDINIENLRFGTHSGNPMVIDGLVIQLKYDDITSPNKKLTDIIIGSNYLEGSFFGDFYRVTGYLNPKLPHKARVGALNTFGFIEIFNEAPVPVSMKRDSFLWMVDHYKMTYEDLDPGKDDKIYYAAPWDPVNNDIRTGFFLRLGLDPNSEHFGYSLIAGYNEIVANAYEPSGVMLQDALYNWWNN